MYRDANVLLPIDPLADLRGLDVARKRGDRIDPDLDVVHELGEVDLLLREHVDLATALVGG